MRTLWLTLASGAIVFSVQAGVQDNRALLGRAARAMGATNLRSIEYSGSGFTYGFAQAPGPGEPWPLFVAKSYSLAVEYETPALRLELVRAQGEHPPRGGAGQPIAGDLRTVQFVRPADPPDRTRLVWMTPHGLIKSAVANRATVSGKTLTFSIAGQDVRVTLDDRDLVSRLEYMVDNAVLGDTPIEMTYSGYADYGGVQFPTRIVEKTDGYPTLDITVKDVKPNTSISIAAAAAPSTPPAQPAAVQAQKLAEGVWHLIASNYGSIAVEFADHVVMFEGPLGDARTMAVNEWVQKTIGKPIKYLVNTHTHFDHAGGVRAYVAEGVTIITHEMNKVYLEKVWARPRTINPDRLARAPKAPLWDAMTEKKVLTDGARTLELHQIKNNGHHPYILMGYLPRERILLYGDMYNPPAGSDPRDLARTNEYASNLYDNIQRLRLDAQLIAPIHGRPVPLDNLKKAIGLLPVPP